MFAISPVNGPKMLANARLLTKKKRVMFLRLYVGFI